MDTKTVEVSQIGKSVFIWILRWNRDEIRRGCCYACSFRDNAPRAARRTLRGLRMLSASLKREVMG
jgi:hypothetical protein